MAKVNQIKKGSKVKYTEPFDDQLDIIYQVTTDVTGEWINIQPMNSVKSAITANIHDLKLVK